MSEPTTGTLGMSWALCPVCGTYYQDAHSCGGSPSATGSLLTCPTCGQAYYVGLGHVCAWVPGAYWWLSPASPPLTADQVRQIVREEIEAARERDAK